MEALVVFSRPVCNDEAGGHRCRKTAVVSHDGVWLCKEHRLTAEVVKYATKGVDIKWVKAAR